MNKNKKYKYNITFYKGAVDNMSNKLLDYKYSYNPEDIIKAINVNYSDMNMFNSSNAKDTSHEQQTKIRQDELNKKEKERLDNIKLLEEKEEPGKLLEENKQMLEMIKKIEHAEIKEFLLNHGEKEENITEN